MTNTKAETQELKTLSVGVEDFEKLISSGFYYVDKTLFIKELLDNWSDVNLFLRPRRFGKTLTLSTLQYFFEDTGDEEKNAERRKLFTDLNIAEAGPEYTDWQTSRPVISLTLKDVKKKNYALAYESLVQVVAAEYRKHSAITDRLPVDMAEKYNAVMGEKGSESHYQNSLFFLSECLFKVTGKKSVILIDEYDAPLDGAWLQGYYSDMIDLIRSLFSAALKSNDNLEFAVITGCLRVSRESVFTGMNNLKIYSITANRFGDGFGFTQTEVDALLSYYGEAARTESFRKWYDGYKIGGYAVYNPWSVINTLSDFKGGQPGADFGSHWANTSSNDIVKRLILQSDDEAKEEMETLMAGGEIEKTIREDLTYSDLEISGDYTWNFMLFTGYLTITGSRQDHDETVYTLKIPNTEVRRIYERQVKDWFNERLKGEDLTPLYDAILQGDADKMSGEITELLLDTISYYDYSENYYHGFLAGILRGMSGYIVKSNREIGLGRPDLTLCPKRRKNPYIVFEFKKANDYDTMETACQAALAQIDKQRYAIDAKKEGCTAVLYYGIAFHKKEALVAASLTPAGSKGGVM
ncbi:MAG: ATP-binding protein [Gracilibacteraceae bacterium]|nr:ATP-binding protein [Gracilibacteraceae bacterium]